jgi:hypothetical protein
MALCFAVAFGLELRYGAKTFAQMVGGAPTLQGVYRHYAEAQRERGGYEQYRDALLDYNRLSELAQSSPLMSVLFDHSGGALNYTRLSRLESELGTPGEAKRYIDLAVAECAAVERDRDCTPESLLDFLDLFETVRRTQARDRIRRDKEAVDNIWTGPKKVWFPPQ